MKISVITTILNEEEFILALLFGLLTQIKQPDEVMIVDGGSTDSTVQLIKLFQQRFPSFPLRLLIKPGNRSHGRNHAITQAQHNWIAITDAGCVPHREWLVELAVEADRSRVEVIAGYYQSAPATTFQQAVTPYMLVMPDRLNQDYFLPATRSMLIHKLAWKEVGGFDEDLTLSEDYDFTHRLERAGFKLSFTPYAQVSWWPIETFSQFYRTVYDMARCDAQAKITRIKAYLVICRYVIFALLAFVFFCTHWLLGTVFIIISALAYSSWAMWKNAQYLDNGWLYLPLLQLAADGGVIMGTLAGSLTNS